MSRITAVLMLTTAGLLPAAALAAALWTWVDKNGVTHYSDRPVEGAKRIDVEGPPKTGNVPPPAPARPAARPAEQDQSFRYTGCEVNSPQRDQVLLNADTVTVSVRLEPGPRPDDLIQVFLDGQRITNWPPSSTSHLLSGLYRGSHTLAVFVLDPKGQPLCQSAPLTFHVRLPTVNGPASPGR